GIRIFMSEICCSNLFDTLGYANNYFTNVDFHGEIENIQSYNAVILSTHPEYWSTAMQDNLQTYLDQGGKLLYLGGNGMYRIVDFLLDPDHPERDYKAFTTSSLESPPFLEAQELVRKNVRSERRI